MSDKGLAQIDTLTRSFFSLFDNRGNLPDISRIYELFLEDGIILKCIGEKPEIYTVKEFAESRKAILSNGELLDFYEEELHCKTDIFGNIAQRICIYRKSGLLSGVAFTTFGIKTIQFVNTEDGFRMSAVAWDDEREGFAPDSFLKEKGF